MKKNPMAKLRTGFTTGACAAAAAKGAALMLCDQSLINEVTIDLPAGLSATFKLEGQQFSTSDASCFVIKDAGDDPDITNGAEVHALIKLDPPSSNSAKTGNTIVITGGRGIGKATKPGLAVAPGEWAINPVPWKMISEAVRTIIPNRSLNVEISIPDGEARATKTLNARLGILGGLSILGTTGIVRPISAKAWTDTIDTALDVARACGRETVIFSTGRASELAVRNQFNAQDSSFNMGKQTTNHKRRTPNHESFPEETYVMMGDHVAHALRSARQRGFMRPIIACQFAKLVKIACGYENTHAVASEMDLARLRQWAEEGLFPSVLLDTISTANTAREIAVHTCFDPGLILLVVQKASLAAQKHAVGVTPLFIVADYSSRIIFNSFLSQNNE